MAQLFVNNGNSTLSAALGTGDTTLFVAAGHGARFPAVAAPDFCFVTLEDASGNIEIIKVTAHTAGNTSMTIVRAQQGTTARSWSIGDLVELRATASEMTAWEAMQTSKATRAGDTYTGAHDFSGASGVTLPAATSIGNVSAAEIAYLDGVTSGLQGQLNAKADITGETYSGTHDFTGGTVNVPTASPGSTGSRAASLDFVAAMAFSSALPGYAGNALKVLRVNAGETSAEWAPGFPAATGNEGKTLSLDATAAPAWVDPPDDWANWTLITANGGTFAVPPGRSKIRAYVFGKGGDGASVVAGGGGGGGGCTYGTIPCKPGDVFTFDSTSGAVLKLDSTTYLSANNGNSGSGTTGGAGASAGTVAGGLGITSSGAAAGGAGGAGGAGSQCGGGGGASGSPLGTGGSGGTGNSGRAGGGGWGAGGNSVGGGGVGSAMATGLTLSGAFAVNGEAASRDWSNAFIDPLLRPCNFGSPIHNFNRLVASSLGPMNAAPGSGGGRTNTGSAHGGAGGLGGGGGPAMTNGYHGGNGGFGGGGGAADGGSTSGHSGSGGIGGGGAGQCGTGSTAGSGGSAGVIIFW